MPPQSRALAVHAQLRNISMCLDIATQTLDVISGTFKTTYLQPISLTVKAMIKLTESIKQERGECASLLEQTNEVLTWIISLHLRAEELTLNRLSYIEDFLGTLHKIHTFIEEQQEGSKIKKFFHHSQRNVLLKACRAGLQQAIDILKIRNIDLGRDIDSMKIMVEEQHQEVLEFITNLSENTSSDAQSLSVRVPASLYNSSTSFSMLLPEPKIFCGRESELTCILELLQHCSPRIAFLGPGGMGKTTLARVVLHNSDVVVRYGSNRFFIPCDTVSTKQELMNLVGLHFGLERGCSGKDMIQHISGLSHSLLVLDNLETVWEPYQSRKEVEDFLSLIASSELLALIITMRGAERPGQVPWTHPFLQPLQPLPQDAALRMFVEIADDTHDHDDIGKLLSLTDCLPLAIDLLAHLADSEGLSRVLDRWEREKTSMISYGYDQRSNLDRSIGLSLSSPRLDDRSGAKELLALLSLLPDGLSDADLLQSHIPIKDILGCKTALLCTSLAYINHQRLKVLVPIREYMQAHHPPLLSSTESLFHTYSPALERFFYSVQGVESNSMTISANFANMQNIILFRWQHLATDLRPTIYAALHLNHFSQSINQQAMPLMAQISTSMVQPPDPRLEVCWAIDCIYANKPMGPHELETITMQALEHFPHFDDSRVKCRFYQCVGGRYLIKSDLVTAMRWFQKTLQMAISTGDFLDQSISLERLALTEQILGNFAAGLAYASEAQQFAQISGSLKAEVDALHVKSVCLRELGRYSECLTQTQRAHILITLGELHKSKSEYIQAQDIVASLLTYSKNSIFGEMFIQLSLAEFGVEAGSMVQDVKNHIDKARQGFNDLGIESYLTPCDVIGAALHLREGNMLAATEILERSLRSSQDNETRTYCLEKLGDIMLWSSAHFAPTWPSILLAHAVKSKQKLQIYKALQFLGDLAVVNGDHNTASSLLSVSLDAFTHMDIHRSRAECMLQLGNISYVNGHYQEAEQLWTTARPLFERSSQGKKVLLMDEKLAEVKKVQFEQH